MAEASYQPLTPRPSRVLVDRNGVAHVPLRDNDADATWTPIACGAGIAFPAAQRHGSPTCARCAAQLASSSTRGAAPRARALAAAVALGVTVAGCSGVPASEDLADRASPVLQDARSTVENIDLDKARRTATQAVTDAIDDQPVSALSCPPRTIKRSGISVTVTCSGTLRNGRRVTIPVRYTPGIGFTPDLPKLEQR